MRVDPERLRPADVPALVGDPSRLRGGHRLGAARSRSRRRSRTCSPTGAARVARRGRPQAMKVLLTGATGFLGKNVARQLAARGHALRILARAHERTRACRRASRSRAGDVTDAAVAARGGARAAAPSLHMAALVKNWVPGPRALRGDERRRASGTRSRRPGRRAPGSSTRRRSWRSARRAPGAPTSPGCTPGRATATTTSAPRRSRTPRRARRRPRGRRRGHPLPGRRLRPGRDDRRQHRGADDRRPPERPPAGLIGPRRPALVVCLRRGRGRGPRARAREGARRRALRALRRERDAASASSQLVQEIARQAPPAAPHPLRASPRASAARSGCGRS